jgi:GT2 family glycosyltransferase
LTLGVAVPSLNQRRFLGAALDSFQRSSVRTLRAVLDGGSTDGSADLISQRSRELAFWRSSADAGQAAAVNEGITRLCALHPEVDAVTWLNADDFYVDEGLDKLSRALLDHPAWVAVAARGMLATEDGKLAAEIPTEAFSRDRFSRACTICQPATLIRRSAWEKAGGLDTRLDMCFDYDLWWRLARLGPIGYLHDVVAASRDHGATKTRQRRRQYFQEATAIVRRETGDVPWHWYISEAIERRMAYEVGRRPGLGSRLIAAVDAARAYLGRPRPVS